jgi:hypothetical protein
VGGFFLKGDFNMLKTVEIYARDLKPEALANLLKIFETSIAEANWDIYPIAIVDMEMDSPKGKENGI